MRSLAHVVAKHKEDTKKLSVLLKEHATRLSSSAVGQHFSECEHAQYLASLQNQFTLLNDLPQPSYKLSPIEILVLNNNKILTQPNVTTTTFLPFLKHYSLNTTNLSLTPD